MINGSRRPDQVTYNASSIDWKKLNSWARKVAQTTPVPPTAALALTVTDDLATSKTVKEGGFLGIGSRERTVDVIKKVTHESHVITGHWVLDTRVSEETKWYGDSLHADFQTYYMLLETDGSLTTVLHVMRYRDISHGRGVGAGGHREIDDNYAAVKSFTGTDVEHFDYEKVRAHWVPKGRGRFPGEAMNDTTGSRLQRHARGVGLSMRLKDLSTGPLQNRPWHNKHIRLR